MDRILVWPGAIPVENDHLNSNRNAMVGLSKVASAVLGLATQFAGLTVSASYPASMSIVVGAGEIYSLASLDAAAYSSLPADNAHQILKQGINLDPTALTLAAPVTPGQAINYSIQASFSEIDNGGMVLPYYNASNPSQAFSGPGNDGISQPTARVARVVLNAVAGAAAPVGTQTTPATVSGAVCIGVVTVPYGTTALNTGNISAGTSPIAPLSSYANLNSPSFSGTPTAPTPLTSDDSNQVATTGFVHSVVESAVPDLSGYAPKNSPTFTGTPKAPTPAAGDNSTAIATTAFLRTALLALAGTLVPNAAGGSGYALFPMATGPTLIMQFGEMPSVDVHGSGTATLPVTLPNGVLFAGSTCDFASGSADARGGQVSVSNSQVTVYAGAVFSSSGGTMPMRWFVIGY